METRKFASAIDALEFITAGNAYFTLRSERTGARYTYRVRGSEDGKVRFVSYLAGSNNENDYVYLGIIANDTFRLTAKSNVKPDSIVYRAFQYAWQRLQRGIIAPELEIWHEGQCGRCGRLLTVPESIDRGIGPECAKKLICVEA